MAGTLVLLLTGGTVALGLLLYNVLAAALFLREATEGSASGLARAAWGLGLLSVFLWWAPCLGFSLAVVALAVAAIERGRIFRDEAALAGVTPIRLANLDAAVVIGLQMLVLVALVASRLG